MASSHVSLRYPCLPSLARLIVCVEMMLFAFVAISSHSAFADEESQLLIMKKKWPEAVIVLRSIVSKDHHQTGAQVDLARALIYLGRREEALSVLGDAIRREQGKKQEWLIQQNRVFSKIFITNATFQTFQDGLNLLVTQKYKMAREKFEKALATEGSNVEILTRLGQAYLLDGDHDSAAEQLKTANRLNPYEPEIKLWLGRALQLRGEVSESLIELRAANSELKSTELARIWIADALEASGQKTQALQVLQEDSQNYPLHLMSLVNGAKLKIQLAAQATARDGQSRAQLLWSARQDFQNALSRFPDFLAAEHKKSEGDLGLEYPIEANDFRQEIQTSMQKLQTKLEELESSTN